MLKPERVMEIATDCGMVNSEGWTLRFARRIEAEVLRESATREPVAWTETAEITEEQWHSLKRTAAAPAAPGWKLVPVEPTREMKDACDNVRGPLTAWRCFKEMLAAAPEPPVGKEGG